MAGHNDDDRGPPTKEEISKALWDLYRAITSPYEVEWELPTERARWILIQLGYDPDTWDPPRRHS